MRLVVPALCSGLLQLAVAAMPWQQAYTLQQALMASLPVHCLQTRKFAERDSKSPSPDK